MVEDVVRFRVESGFSNNIPEEKDTLESSCSAEFFGESSNPDRIVSSDYVRITRGRCEPLIWHAILGLSIERGGHRDHFVITVAM